MRKKEKDNLEERELDGKTKGEANLCYFGSFHLSFVYS
jgi:hypothetical protein